jgi:hypothetical protein
MDLPIALDAANMVACEYLPQNEQAVSTLSPLL